MVASACRADLFGYLASLAVRPCNRRFGSFFTRSGVLGIRFTNLFGLPFCLFDSQASQSSLPAAPVWLHAPSVHFGITRSGIAVGWYASTRLAARNPRASVAEAGRTRRTVAVALND